MYSVVEFKRSDWLRTENMLLRESRVRIPVPAKMLTNLLAFQNGGTMPLKVSVIME